VNLSAYAAPLSLTPAATPVRNPLGVYGKPEYMLMGKTLIKKRPTEIRACKHILRPDDPEFIPAPSATKRVISPNADYLYCFKCKTYKSPGSFHRDPTRPSRGHRDARCKECKKLSTMRPWHNSAQTSLPINLTKSKELVVS